MTLNNIFKREKERDGEIYDTFIKNNIEIMLKSP